MKRGSRRLSLNQGPTGSLQAHFLISGTRQMGGGIEVKGMVRREVRQCHIDMVVYGTRPRRLLVRERHLPVGNAQLAQRELLPRRGGLLGLGLRRTWRLLLGWWLLPRRAWLRLRGRSLPRSLLLCSHGSEIPHALRVFDQLHARPHQG